MKILKDVPLKLYSTMRLGGKADFMTIVKSKDDLKKAEEWAEERELPIRVIGDGSNIIWRDEGFKGLLVVNKIGGFKLIDENEDSATYQIGAGENWDNIVDQLVGLGLSGVEGLSLIPGTAGAAPVQNIGAYGQELADTFVELEAYDRMEKDFVAVPTKECGFGYRTSRFKSVDNGRFLISSITLKLPREFTVKKQYPDIEKYFSGHKVNTVSPESYRKAVIAVRTKKLPNPNKIANTGSFFGNPIVTNKEFSRIAKKHPKIKKNPPGWSQPPFWELPHNKVKLSAGWLVEQAGFTDKIDAQTGMKLWPNQKLVLVNHRAQSTHNLLTFEQKITDAVLEKFGVELEREPELLP